MVRMSRRLPERCAHETLKREREQKTDDTTITKTVADTVSFMLGTNVDKCNKFKQLILLSTSVGIWRLSKRAGFGLVLAFNGKKCKSYTKHVYNTTTSSCTGLG